MVRILISIYQEDGLSMEIGDGNGQVWGLYSILGKRAKNLIRVIANIIGMVDPIIGCKFEWEEPRKRKGKHNDNSGQGDKG